MDVWQQVTMKYSLKTKFSFLLGALVIIILVGNWYSFQRSKHVFFKEVQARGSWIARNLAYSVQFSEFLENEDRLHQLMKVALWEPDVMYIALLDKNAQAIFSESKYDQKNLPDVVQNTFCENGEPFISDHNIDNEQIYNVGVRITRQNECLGTIHIGVSLKSTHDGLTHLFTIVLVITGFVTLIGVIGHSIFSRILLAPILRMSEVAMKISEGDLRQTIEITANDEVGALATALLRILQSSQALATQLQEACEHIKTSSDEIMNMSEDQSSLSQKQVMSIYRVSQTVEEIAESSKHIATNADTVVQDAESTLKSALNIGETLQDTISSMKEIRDQVGKNTERVVLLGERISQIRNVVKIINTIADQTKLIAFNASIEAAGAGESGGRFSVVATEVRRLANTVVESVAEIKDSVTSIQIATSELILSSETGIRKVNQGSLLITQISSTLQQIMTMLEKTTGSARGISESMQQQRTESALISEGIRELSDDSEQSLDQSKRVSEVAEELRTLAEELDATMQRFIT